MVWSRYKIRVPGKWVLAGEHSVLRRKPAMALPHPDLGLTISFQPKTESVLQVFPANAQSIVFELIHLLGNAPAVRERIGPSADWKPEGVLEIESTIPIGAGLGSSAALCVALVRWFSDRWSIPPELGAELATYLEHRFHGRSSGMDVAAIFVERPILFEIGQAYQPIQIRRLPKFTFHDTGLRSKTSDCVALVNQYREQNPVLGAYADDAMGEASIWAMKGLVEFDSGDEKLGMSLVKKAILQAQECYHTWGLVPDAAKVLEETLVRQGALAVKLTGAGMGGIMVALWEPGSGVL